MADFSQATADLIERQCKNIERKDFILNKEEATECLLKTYDLFDLPRPKRVEWCTDIFDEAYALSARSAGSALSAGSAWSAWSARSAGSALSAGSAWSAWSARSAWSAGSARSAWSAWSARSAGSALSAWSAWSALDYDFDWYVFEYEYCQNPDADKPPNEHDKKYLDYCELLMQAKEHGMGYRVEWEDTLYCVPTPLVRIDDRNRFHSETEPAIRWKGGKEFWFLHGVSVDEHMHASIVGKSMTAKECLALKNIEQRMIALKYLGAESLLKEANALKVDSSTRGNELYVIPKEAGIFLQDEYFVKYKCPSIDRVYIKCVEPDIGRQHDADLAQASTFQYPDWAENGLEWKPCTKEMYATIALES